MKRIVLISLILTVTSLYSQETYPKKLVINSDTLVAITEKHTKIINKCFIDVFYCNIENDSLRKEVKILKEVVKNDSLVITSQSLDLTKYQEIITNKGKINETTIKELDKLKIQLEKEEKLSNTRVMVLGGSLVINVVLILLYSLK